MLSFKGRSHTDSLRLCLPDGRPGVWLLRRSLLKEDYHGLWNPHLVSLSPLLLVPSFRGGFSLTASFMPEYWTFLIFRALIAVG